MLSLCLQTAYPRGGCFGRFLKGDIAWGGGGGGGTLQSARSWRNARMEEGIFAEDNGGNKQGARRTELRKARNGNSISSFCEICMFRSGLSRPGLCDLCAFCSTFRWPADHRLTRMGRGSGMREARSGIFCALEVGCWALSIYWGQSRHVRIFVALACSVPSPGDGSCNSNAHCFGAVYA